MAQKKLAYDRLKQRNKRRMRRQRLALWLLLVCMLVIVATLCMTVFFKIESVSVSGDHPYRDEEVLAKADIVLGSNLFKLDKKGVKTRVETALPYVESVYVDRRWPAAVVLKVTTAHPMCQIRHGEYYVLLSEKLKVLEVASQPFFGVTTVSGVPCEEAFVGYPLNTGEDEKIGQILTQVVPCAESAGLAVGDLHIDLTNRYAVKLFWAGFEIRAGNYLNMEEKLSFAKKIIERVGADAVCVVEVSDAQTQGSFIPAG